MSSHAEAAEIIHEQIAGSCSYCGRENAERLRACSGCGSALSNVPVVRPKSKRAAIFLAALLGPIGLCYCSISGGISMFLISIAAYIILSAAHLPWYFYTVFGRIACVIWALYAIGEQTPRDAAKDLLEAAARLEASDPQQAIIAYEEIAIQFAGTRAGEEASRNIAVLRKSVTT